MENNTLNDIKKRLEVVISLMLHERAERNGNLSLKDDIKILDSIGLRPIEIAEILGKTNKHVSKELSNLRKNK